MVAVLPPGSAPLALRLKLSTQIVWVVLARGRLELCSAIT